ncbi:hemerythrin domain-containing protein [Mycolicibacterium wolinskyi]|uniref:Hemerythrin n=1 Tax=Mycolicibacterium wolinskyi TaxID=59750 RepID=A0A1X2F9L7_9MYCO|nr:MULTISPECIES: hemerythrin domain-containing protein [Mycolicibacterium]MCV7286381.1 hemerythrin domain-containing protein [Mycolicibacterium wolinskyi]MCV7293361.1 hemerythrin domain-containing protein [Mycolicibacterium goodii]ORX15116.1 hemerythrin [Mycolicibacterium wolinskyi]
MSNTFVQSTDDVVKFLRDQHNLIKDLFEEVFSASTDEAREKAFIELRQLLAVHETAEEMVVHPRVRREVADGEEIVEARLHEEHAAKEQLSKLESMDIGSEEFITELTKFREAVIDHADHEEQEEFNKLQRKLDADDLERMAKAVQAAEAIAPTRPHAGVESATANFAIGPFASMLDRARDLIGAALR